MSAAEAQPAVPTANMTLMIILYGNAVFFIICS